MARVKTRKPVTANILKQSLLQKEKFQSGKTWWYAFCCSLATLDMGYAQAKNLKFEIDSGV